MANKEISISVDIDRLNSQLEQQKEVRDLSELTTLSAKSSVFVLGRDPRVSSQHISTPELTYIEVLKDGLDNPYIQVNWQLKREDIDSGQIVSFDVYRRLKKPEESPSFFAVQSFDRDAFAKLSIKSKRVGKFSENKKAITNVKRGLIDLSTLNNNLFIEQQLETRFNFSETTGQIPGYTTSYAASLGTYNYKKIANVTYSKFIAEENKRFLVSTDRNIATLYYRDKTVGYGETYEYYVVSVAKQLGKNATSNSAIVTIEDFTPPHAPAAITVKQTKETEVQVMVSFDLSSKPNRILIYKKSSLTISFAFAGDLKITGQNLIFTDRDVQYGQNYSYRVFVQNIHGLISDPIEVDFFTSVHKVTPESKFNNFKQPILTAVQDQNSDFIKINIFPNDPLIAYYVLERRDLTNKEKKFISPSKENNGYGGDGWTTNQFFVTRRKEQIQDDLKNSIDKIIFDQINFIDDTAQIGHTFQYRARGYDLFGNGSSYVFSIVTTEGKKSVRTPINLRKEPLRGFPLRYKIVWDDDNLVNNLSSQDPFNTTEKVTHNVYKVQRRKIGQNVYESFPLTPNKFVVDEVVSGDPVDFADQSLPSSNFFREDSLNITQKEYEDDSKLRRSFGMPNFLLDGDTYSYRVFAINKGGEQSNATEELKTIAIADLSDPIEFGAEVLNTKVRPLISRLFWKVDTTKAFPDFWTIERKVDTKNEDFRQIGNSYIQLQYFDFNLAPGHTYIYRIRAYDTIGRVSNSVEARLAVY